MSDSGEILRYFLLGVLLGCATLRIAARIVLTFGTGISIGSPFFG